MFGMQTTLGYAIFWDAARGILYFTTKNLAISYDEDLGVFLDDQNQEFPHDGIDTAVIRNQELINQISDMPSIQGFEGQFIPFKGFNEEVEWELIEWDE